MVLPRLQKVSSAHTTIHAICSNEDNMKAGLFATVVWTLWNNRNNKVWNYVVEPGRNLGYKAKQYWEEWFMVQNLQHVHASSAQQQHNN
jgi:hypothetical protein